MDDLKGHVDQKKEELWELVREKYISKTMTEAINLITDILGEPSSQCRGAETRVVTYLLGGAATCSEGFVNVFLRVPQAVGLYCSCHAAQASRGNF